jgi:hypothetical protein
MLDIAAAYPYRLCHYNINKIILGPCPISHFPNMSLYNRVMSISTLFTRADSTRRCYRNAFEKWCKWCVSVKLPSFPATEFHVSLYLIHLSDPPDKLEVSFDKSFHLPNWKMAENCINKWKTYKNHSFNFEINKTQLDAVIKMPLKNGANGVYL